MNYKEYIGKQILLRILDLRLTKKVIIEKTGLSGPTITSICLGRNYSTNTLQKLLNYLGCTTNLLWKIAKQIKQELEKSHFKKITAPKNTIERICAAGSSGGYHIRNLEKLTCELKIGLDVKLEWRRTMNG